MPIVLSAKCSLACKCLIPIPDLMLPSLQVLTLVDCFTASQLVSGVLSLSPHPLATAWRIFMFKVLPSLWMRMGLAHVVK